MKLLRILALITLGFLGVTSIAGSIPMILDPSGSLLHMPLSLLAHSPFRNFLIPGIILLVTNGLVVIVVMAAAVRRVAGYGNLVAAQGVVIVGWISVEVIFLRTVVWAHYVYWAVGLILIVFGLVLRRDCPVGEPVLVATR
jgi:hypothetical protein